MGFKEQREAVKDAMSTYKSTFLQRCVRMVALSSRGDVTVKLAEHYGFVGVERAIAIAYEAALIFLIIIYILRMKSFTILK